MSGEGNPIKPATVALTPTEKLGNILVDDAGMSLYLFTKDTPGVTNCYGKCEIAWPPLLTIGQPTLGDNVSAGAISTTVRKDGSVQVTYNGWPLYYYFKDKAPGDVTGQAVGKVWWVVSGEGNPIKPAALAITPTEKLGKILVDGDGRTLYMFTKDTQRHHHVLRQVRSRLAAAACRPTSRPSAMAWMLPCSARPRAKMARSR